MKDNGEKNPDCPCDHKDCPRNAVCKECKEYHHALGQKTSCEKKKESK